MTEQVDTLPIHEQDQLAKTVQDALAKAMADGLPTLQAQHLLTNPDILGVLIGDAIREFIPQQVWTEQRRPFLLKPTLDLIKMVGTSRTVHSCELEAWQRDMASERRRRLQPMILTCPNRHVWQPRRISQEIRARGYRPARRYEMISFIASLRSHDPLVHHFRGGEYTRLFTIEWISIDEFRVLEYCTPSDQPWGTQHSKEFYAPDNAMILAVKEIE